MRDCIFIVREFQGMLWETCAMELLSSMVHKTTTYCHVLDAFVDKKDPFAHGLCLGSLRRARLEAWRMHFWHTTDVDTSAVLGAQGN